VIPSHEVARSQYPAAPHEELSVEDLIGLCADDPEFFCRHFFPRTFRQASPEFHREIWRLLSRPGDRLVNIQVFRDGAKTTLLRAFTAFRIAFGLSRTILYIGKSESHAVRSLDWIRRQVEYSKTFSRTFGLRPGKKWGGEEVEVYHGAEEVPIWVMAMGITGSVRGINRDDFRPDLIVVDDVVDEENGSTPEQRKKINELLHGAIKESLAPESESPLAKLVMLQTPIHSQDPSTTALRDPEWINARFSCWTPETADLPLEKQESSWPERYPSADLRRRKALALQGGRYYIFAREKELRLTSPETAAFSRLVLQTYDLEPERNEMQVVMWIDPVPPPSESQIAKGFAKKDFEAFAVVGRMRDKFFLLDYRINRGHQPDWTIETFFELGLRWRPRTVYVESVAYQRTLAFLLRQAMTARRIFFAVNEVDDRRRKHDRILDGLTGPASEGKLFIRPTHIEFREQFEMYPDVANDDLIEAVAGCVEKLNFETVIEGDFEEVVDERPVKRLAWRNAP
jgi:hypothetical protein